MNKDRGDVLRVVKPHIGPRRTAIVRSIDTVTKAYVTASNVFARAHPNGIRI